MHHLKSYGINKKDMFLSFLNYLKSETSKILKKITQTYH